MTIGGFDCTLEEEEGKIFQDLTAKAESNPREDHTPEEEGRECMPVDPIPEEEGRECMPVDLIPADEEGRECMPVDLIPAEEEGRECMPVDHTPEEEGRIIQDLTAKAESNLREGNNYYLISTRWYVTWQKYTGQPVGDGFLLDLEDQSSTSAERPGPIDNTDLVSPGHNPQLLDTIMERRDYVLLAEEAWGRLYEWYKGGPAIARKMIAVGYRKQLTVDVFLVRLHLVDSRDESRSDLIQLSRKASLNELYQAVCQKKGLEREKVRLWDYLNLNKHAVLDAHLNRTLDDCGLYMDNHILVEELEEGDGMDSTGNYMALQVPMGTSTSCISSLSNGYSSVADMDMDESEDETRQDREGLVGLQNLGNTCFMNSSLQCLAHTPPIMEYFLQDYSDEINKENPLGMNGELALAFGKLLRKLWSSGKASVPPREFKQRLAHFAPQFSGYNQHDSQELLAFLLDGLHEDLNRVKQKPYIETKDSDGCPDEEVADDLWGYHKARNNSIIVDVCQGQYKSTLVCPSCSKVSFTFDPFMYLSLPLPLTSKRTMTVTVFHGDGSALPMEITVTVLKHVSCQDLIDVLSTQCSLSTDEYLLLAEVFDHKVYKYFEKPSEDLLESIKDYDRIVAYRLPKTSMNSNFPKLEITHRFTQKAHYLRFGVPKLILTPLVTFWEDPQSSTDIDEAIDKVLAPFRNDECTSPLSGHEDMPEKSTSETEKLEFTFDIVTNSFHSNFQRMLRNTPVNFKVPIVKVQLEWTKREVEFYDPRSLEGVPNTGINAQKTKQEKVSLFSCLDAFLKEEPLEADNMWYCPDCKEHRQATKKLDLWRLPDVLVFHLKRFSHSRRHTDKLDTFVDFPIRDLDLSNYVKAAGDHVYELYAISNHYGGLGGGHYSAYCKLIDDDKKWYKFDDSHVSEVDEDGITTPAAYVLFYRRVGTKSNAAGEESSNAMVTDLEAVAEGEKVITELGS